jgi:hypothetical protein
MTCNLSLFVGPPAALAPFVTLSRAARLYTLQAHTDLAVLPFDADVQDHLHDRFGTGDWPEDQSLALSTTDQSFAADCSRHAPLAFLQFDTDENGAFQSAALWQLGRLSLGPATLDMKGAGVGRAATLRPINIALRALGVIATADVDEFSAFGLSAYTSNAEIHALARPVRI